MPDFTIGTTGEAVTRFVWLALLHSVWVGLGTAGTVGVLLPFARRLSHRSQHGLLLVALAITALLPVLAAGLPERSHHCRLRADAPAGPLREIDRGRALTAVGVSRIEKVDVRGPTGEPKAVEVLSRAFKRAERPAVAFWTVGALAGLAAILVGATGAGRLRAGSRPIPAEVSGRLRALTRRTGLARVPSVLAHDGVEGPCLIGLFRPTVLLPGGWLSCAPTAEVDAVVAHEMAHAMRLDPLANLAQRTIEALLFFHPGARWLSRAVRLEREHCADELAVRLTGDPVALACALSSLARRRATPTRRAALSFLDGDPLVSRIQELIGMTPRNPTFRRWSLVALPSALAFAGALASVGLADEPPSARPSSSALPPVPTAEAPSPTVSNDRQLSYEVAFFTAPLQSRIDRLLKRSPLRAEGDAKACVLQQPARNLLDLLDFTQLDPKTNMLQSPKVTAYEGVTATITHPPEGARASDANPVPPSGPADPNVVRVDCRGEALPSGSRLTVELHESSLAIGRERDPEASPPVGLKGGTLRLRATCDVPEDSSLLISLGKTGQASGGQGETGERIVVITPRKYVPMQSMFQGSFIRPVAGTD